jgi:hypothetical protein
LLRLAGDAAVRRETGEAREVESVRVDPLHDGVAVLQLAHRLFHGLRFNVTPSEPVVQQLSRQQTREFAQDPIAPGAARHVIVGVPSRWPGRPPPNS